MDGIWTEAAICISFEKWHTWVIDSINNRAELLNRKAQIYKKKRVWRCPQGTLWTLFASWFRDHQNSDPFWTQCFEHKPLKLSWSVCWTPKIEPQRFQWRTHTAIQGGTSKAVESVFSSLPALVKSVFPVWLLRLRSLFFPSGHWSPLKSILQRIMVLVHST